MHPVKTALAIGATLIGIGCASAPQPTEQLASAEASVRAAHELGADSVPRAQLHLKLAQEQVTQARKLAQDGEEERANLILSRARADAELALALTREAAAHRDLQAVTPAPTASAQPTSMTTTSSTTVSTIR
jgi:hypothetical protein